MKLYHQNWMMNQKLQSFHSLEIKTQAQMAFKPVLFKNYTSSIQFMLNPSVICQLLENSLLSFYCQKPNKQDYSSPCHFRPISLPCVLGKILETIINTGLEWFSIKNNWFSKHRHGFTGNKCTVTALNGLISDMETGFTNQQQTLAVRLGTPQY